MTQAVLFGSLVIGAIAVLQSTVLRFTEIAGIAPDLVLVIVVFLANKNGTMTGQLTGFFGGLALDVMGLSPVGFYALMYTLIGALFGMTRGKMFVDPIIMPIALAVAALMIKGLLAVLVAAVFAIGTIHSQVFSPGYLLEIGYTGLLAPIVFAILGMMRRLQPDRRRGEIAQ